MLNPKIVLKDIFDYHENILGGKIIDNSENPRSNYKYKEVPIENTTNSTYIVKIVAHYQKKEITLGEGEDSDKDIASQKAAKEAIKTLYKLHIKTPLDSEYIKVVNRINYFLNY